MANTNPETGPEETPGNPENAAEATRETSGHSIDGDTPPAEGASPEPTNNELDVDRRGAGVMNKVWLVALLVLVLVFVVFWIIGSIAGLF
ncbi:DUF6480 family protein [Citricoccus parietis]|uniref:Uncharacterized protein n=3 Tax=Citricoccus TaxID=169133 RepID=A0A3D9LCY9_9MICC|nr:DUF6480 family protein [Citricoccus muralis]REE04269.1 hypothetical protein C8E99_2098 [Citricoccus muralis]